MASNFGEKYREFMKHRNGPDDLARLALVIALILFVLSVLLGDTFRSTFMILGVFALIYSYWRLFSTDIVSRSRENESYVKKRNELLAKITAPFKGAAKRGEKAAAQAKDKEHKYFACPKCGQTVRVPKGAGKIRVTCPKCGEKFEKKA
ncbi:MAG: zinc ribbon domain-containing protein [Coriobacteriales bacterium]|nr:zinc ribbon domain-containing protein [Coriobacteriales bacterium]